MICTTHPSSLSQLSPKPTTFSFQTEASFVGRAERGSDDELAVEKCFQRPKAAVIVTVSSDCVAKIWSVKRLQLENFMLLSSTTAGGKTHVTKAIVIPKTRLLIVGYSDGTMCVCCACFAFRMSKLSEMIHSLSKQRWGPQLVMAPASAAKERSSA